MVGLQAVDYDFTREFPHQSLNELWYAGLWSMRVLQEYGGLGLDLVTTRLVVDERSKNALRQQSS